MRHRTKVKLWAWFRYYFRPVIEKGFPGDKLKRCGVCYKIHHTSNNPYQAYCKTCQLEGGHQKLKESGSERYMEGQDKIFKLWDSFRPKATISLRCW